MLVYSPEKPNAPVRFCHTSFSDYLTADQQKVESWFIDVSAQRSFVAERCFDVMVDKPRFNICGIESSFVRNRDVPDIEERVKENISFYLKHVCLNWHARVSSGCALFT